MSKESAVPTDLKLHADEQVYKVIRPVRNAFLSSFIGAILLISIVFGGILWSKNIIGDELTYMYYPMYGMGILASFALAISPYIQMAGNMYIITNRRIIGRFDFIVHRESTIYFERIQNVKVNQYLLDNIFNTGAVYIETAAGSMMPEENLRWIHKPREVRQLIMDLIEAEKRGGDGVSSSTPTLTPVITTQPNESGEVTEILNHILTEIRSIKQEIKKD